jgi:hypothetical protein
MQTKRGQTQDSNIYLKIIKMAVKRKGTYAHLPLRCEKAGADMTKQREEKGRRKGWRVEKEEKGTVLSYLEKQTLRNNK